ncbi:MAG: malonyl-ACP O-methyltransferase BioC [Gammaproteobacteria bacterium]
MTSSFKQRIDRRQMRRAFDRAAAHYDENAVLQHEVGRRLLERLELLKLKPKRILDLGVGTGESLGALLKKYPEAEIYALDISTAMLQQARKKLSWWQRLRHRVRFVNAEAEHLPFEMDRFDMVVSNLALQWCDDLPHVFNELQRILAPGGALLFSTFGPDSLKELRAAWLQVDTEVHIHPFVDMHDIGDAMLRSSLAEPVMDMELITVTYDDAWHIMRDLKNIGAHNVSLDRPRHLTGKQRLQDVVTAYEAYRHAGKLPVTYEIVYGHGWAVETSPPTSVKVQLTSQV